MGPLERRLRRAANPVSTGITRWWLAKSPRHSPTRAAGAVLASPDAPRARSFTTVPSPGEWSVPPGLRPGWAWLPEHGAMPNLAAMPRWARLWFRTPLVDRYAYEWMWWHGGWSVLVPDDSPAPPDDNAAQLQPL